MLSWMVIPIHIPTCNVWIPTFTHLWQHLVFADFIFYSLISVKWCLLLALICISSLLRSFHICWSFRFPLLWISCSHFLPLKKKAGYPSRYMGVCYIFSVLAFWMVLCIANTSLWHFCFVRNLLHKEFLYTPMNQTFPW